MLDTCALVGAVPERFHWSDDKVNLATYFAMARGVTDNGTAHADCVHGSPATALEMTKWFDTNYHYLVPELAQEQIFKLASTKPFDEFAEALALGIRTVPVLVGPLTFLLLAKTRGKNFDRLSLLPKLLSVYAEVLRRLQTQGAEWVQLDEPALCLDLTSEQRAAFGVAYQELREAAPGLKVLLATYFGELRDNLSTACRLPVDALHFDAVRAPQELDRLLAELPTTMQLSLGVVDGRNIWRTDFEGSLKLLRKAASAIGNERLIVSPSCSLLHSPMGLKHETKLDAELKGWLAFAKEKLSEVGLLAQLVNQNGDSAALLENRKAIASRQSSPRIHDSVVKPRAQTVSPSDLQRQTNFATRQPKQQARLNLPAFPTTTIGSFPQTEEVRAARARFKKGELSSTDIAALDADVISIETSRSNMELLGAFAQFHYPNDIGPGVWDIHSPRVPSTGEMLGLIRAAAKVIPKERLWLNPDCGLKTRRWEEVKPALQNLVAAARQARTAI